MLQDDKDGSTNIGLSAKYSLLGEGDPVSGDGAGAGDAGGALPASLGCVVHGPDCGAHGGQD